ncbi:MAG: tetratricopeptide repeat protein [Acidobacteria bacterium]|nr:tetratricopeptide repeat protein [Acidobacteriota bacterium]
MRLLKLFAICLILTFPISSLAFQENEVKDKKEQTNKKEKKEKKEKQDKNKKEQDSQQENQANTEENQEQTPAPKPEPATNPLVTQIELAISLKQLIEPPGQNAYELYQILAKNSPNEPALKSLKETLTLILGDIARSPLELYVQGANYSFTREDWASAQKYSERLKTLQPKDKRFAAFDLFYQGMIALADKDPKKAEELFRQGIKKDDKAPYFYNALGRALSEQKKEEDSLKSYLKAASLAPDWNYPLVNVALKYLRRGNLEEAQRFALGALSVNVNDVEAHSVLGNIYASVGNYDEAIKEYEIVISQRPNSIADQIAYGKLMLEEGNLLAAERAFSTALQANPNDQTAKLYLSITTQRYSDIVLNDATNQLKDVASKNNNAQAQVAIAEGAAHKGNTTLAIEAFQAALKIEPWLAGARLKLATLLAQTGKTAEAIAEYRNVSKTNPSLKEAYFSLGNLLRREGDTKSAILEYRKAIAVAPNFIPAHSNLAILLQEIGELAAAAAEYRAILSIEGNNSVAASALKDLEVKIAEQNKPEPAKTVEEPKPTKPAEPAKPNEEPKTNIENNK